MSAAPRWQEIGLWDLFDLGPMMSGGLDRYLETTLARCEEWFLATSGSIFLAGDSPGVYQIRASRGRTEELPPDTCIRRGRGLAGKVLQTGKPRLIGDPAKEKDFSGIVADPGTASSIIVPLVDPRQGTVGVLNMSREAGESQFTDQDLQQAEAMANLITLAVANARLVEKLNTAVRDVRRTQERLAAVIDAVPGGVIVMDEAGRIDVCSPNAQREALPSEHSPMTPLRRETDASLKRIRVEKEPFVRSVTDHEADRAWVLQAQPLQRGCILTIHEITEHDRSQRKQHQMKRLAEIGQMTAAIAHEFRNPLTGIRSAAQMMRQDPSMADSMAPIVEEEANKLDQLCDEFLEFARPLRLDLAPGRLSPCIDRVHSLLQSEFEEQEIELRLEIAPAEPTIQLDARRIEQVLHNLMRNALQACGPGDTVTVRSGPWSFEVVDTGKGMDPDVLAELFSPFFTTKPDGTGLGMSMAKRIIDEHGGKISARSRPGQGTAILVEMKPNRA